jgi:hypothetical protein
VAVTQFSSVSIPEQVYLMKDATSGFFKINIFEQFDRGFKDAHWAVQFPNNVTLYVVNSIPQSVVDGQPARDFATMYSTPRDAEFRGARLRFVGLMLLVALVPPIIVAACGAATGWIAAGFK